MTRRALPVTQAQIARALRAAKQAGVPARVRVLPDGTLLIEPTSGPEPVEPVKPTSGREIRL